MALEKRPASALICLELEDISSGMPAYDGGREFMGKAALLRFEFTWMREELSERLAALIIQTPRL